RLGELVTMRLLRHLFAPSAHGMFPPEAMARITAAIDAGELRHAGEICFAVDPALHWLDVLRGADPRTQAEDAFARLREGVPADAIVRGIQALSDLLAEHAPLVAGREDRDELPNTPRFL